MIKYLFIVINSVSLFVFGWLNGDNAVTVIGNIPNSMMTGQDVTIEIKINKGILNGFARLQLELPEGVIIKESEDKGSSYSVTGNVAKWVWASLPEDNEISIKLILVASETAVGKKTITAKYSYVEDNVKQSVEMTPAEVDIIKGEGVASIPQASALQANAVSHGEPPGDIHASRTITNGANEYEYNVGIKIKKANTKGFARYSDDMPDGVVAKSAKTDGGSFSVADGKAKFVWVNVPDKEELNISYTLSSADARTITLNGEYSYLENNQSKKIKLKQETLTFGGNELPVTKKGDEKQDSVMTAVPQMPTVEVTPTVTSTQTVPEKQTDPEVKTKEEEKPIVVKKEGKAVFSIQIGAFTSGKVDTKTLVNKFNITENIRSEFAEGYSKFVIGSHPEYKQARDHREKTKNLNGVKSAFVVAYNEGKRVTVQEALMILNQKWFK